MLNQAVVIQHLSPRRPAAQDTTSTLFEAPNIIQKKHTPQIIFGSIKQQENKANQDKPTILSCEVKCLSRHRAATDTALPVPIQLPPQHHRETTSYLLSVVRTELVGCPFVGPNNRQQIYRTLITD